MKFDDILKEIGEFGWYQKRVYFLAAAPSLLVAFETLSVIFIFFIPDHRCIIPGYPSDTFEIQNETHRLLLNRSIPFTDGKPDSCHVFSDVTGLDAILNGDTNGSYGLGSGYNNYDNDNGSSSSSSRNNYTASSQTACSEWVFDHSVFESTIATDFNVVCQNSVIRASSNMVTEIGTLFGTFFIGVIADRFGRKLPFCLGGLALIAGGFGIAFTYDLVSLNVCRFILGVARMAVFVNGVVIGMELVGPSKRALAGILIEFMWCLGEFLLLPFAYFVRNWRYLEIALSVPSIVLLFYWWLVPESPRWLCSRGKVDEAMVILERIARSNNTTMPAQEDTKDLMDDGRQDILNFRLALKSKELLIRVFIVLSNMFVIVVVYYGLTLNVTNLSGDVFINFALMAILEVTAYAVALLLLDRWGRKPLLTSSMILSGVACTASIIPVVLGWPEWVIVCLSMIGRFAVCIAFAVIYVYGAEVFPTVVRSSAMSVGVAFSRCGGLLSPFFADVGLLVGGSLSQALPLVLMGTPALFVGMLSLRLPETAHTTLPETLQDLENAFGERKCLGCCISSKASPAENSTLEVNGESPNGDMPMNGDVTDADGDPKKSPCV